MNSYDQVENLRLAFEAVTIALNGPLGPNMYTNEQRAKVIQLLVEAEGRNNVLELYTQLISLSANLIQIIAKQAGEDTDTIWQKVILHAYSQHPPTDGEN